MRSYTIFTKQNNPDEHNHPWPTIITTPPKKKLLLKNYKLLNCIKPILYAQQKNMQLKILHQPDVDTST